MYPTFLNRPATADFVSNPPRIYAALLTGCLIVMLIAAVSYWSISRYQGDTASVMHSQRIKNSLESIRAHASELQNSVRGYVITGNSTFLEPTAPATVSLDRALRELSGLVADNPDQTRRAWQLEQLIRERKHLAERVEDLRHKSFDSAQAEIIRGEGLRNQDQMLRLVANMRGAEDELMSRRLLRTGRTGDITLASVGVGSILCFVLAAIAFDLVRRDFSRLSRAQRELLGINSQLDQVVARRTSELAASRDLLDRIINSTPPEVHIFSLDRDERFTLVNDSLLRTLGRTRPEVLGRRLDEVLPAETVARMHPEGVRIMESREPMTSEKSIISPDGARRILLSSKFPLVDENGIVVGLGGVATDITERQARESALREAQERYRLLFEKAPVGIALVGSSTGALHDMNPRYAAMVGRTRDELLRTDWIQITHPDDVQKDLDQMVRLNAGDITEFQINKRYLRPDGTVVWVNTLIAALGLPIDGGPTLVCMVEDISERVRFHEQLELFIESAPVALAMFDRDMCYLAASRRWREDYGLGDRVLTGLSHYAAFPDLPERWIEAHRRGMAGEASRAEQDRLEKPDGSVQWLRWELCPWRDASGAIGGIVILTEDITQRQALDAELAAYRADLEAAVQARTAELAEANRKLGDTMLALERVGISVTWVDAGTGRFLYANEHTCKALGFTRTEIEQMAVPEVDSQISAEGFLELSAGIQAHGSRRFETALRHRDGHLIPFEMHVEFLPGRGGQPDRLIGFGTDITERKRMESALQERERLLTESQRLAYIGSWELAHDGRMTWTEEMYRLFETSAESFTPSLAGMAALVHPEDRARFTGAIDNRETGQATLDQIIRRIRSDGTSQYLNLRSEPSQPGAVGARLRGTVQDISALQQASRELAEQQRLRSLTETKAELLLKSTADGMYGIDAEGLITFINPAACAMLGVQADVVRGRLAHELFHHTRVDGNSYPVEDCPIHETLSTGETHRVDDEVFWHADGHSIPVLYGCRPMYVDGCIVGAVVSFVDNTVRKATEAARESALAAAERLARLRQEFLGNVSHELRTPLNGVLGFAEIGLRACQDDEQAVRNFKRIRRSGQHLLGVINDILDFAQIEKGKMEVELVPADLARALDKSLDVVRELADAKNLTLHFERQGGIANIILADPIRLQQVLTNLLSNAVKFTDTGGVSLVVSVHGDRLSFAVSDTGIGMTQADTQRIFRPFEQADGSTSRRHGGSGLGLTISARLVELMGGEITVESTSGVGSTFTLHLPYRPATALPMLASAERTFPRGDLSGLAVLVVEDNPTNRLLMEAMLTSAGALVIAVDNGAAAVERIARDGADAYNLVLMDIQMPAMDGFATAAQIRARAPDLPIVAQTAHALKHDRSQCMAAGMVDYIVKPFTREALLDITRRNARGHGAVGVSRSTEALGV